MRPGFWLLVLCSAVAALMPRMEAGAGAAPRDEGATNLSVDFAVPYKLQFSIGLAASKAQLDSPPISHFVVRRPSTFHVRTPPQSEQIGTLSYGPGGSYNGQPQVRVPLRRSITERGGYLLADAQ